MRRIIDADVLMETLGIKEHCKDCQYSRYERYCTRSHDFVTACKAISDAPAIEPEQRWIPCSESLPDREMHVWVSMCDDDVLRAIWRNGWCAPNGYKLGLTDGQVIAWMPRQTVPEPFRKEGGTE